MAIIWSTRPSIFGLLASRPRPGSASAPGHARRAARPLPGLAALALLAGGAWPALAAPQQCVLEAEKAAFDVRALQSQMMVVALVCERQDDYNAFVERHQRGLLAAYQQLTSHFRRLYGAAAGEVERDRYVTELANTQSQEQVRHGPSFCRNMEPFVRQALAARDTGEISRISAAANVTAPQYPLAACAAPPAVAALPPAPAPAVTATKGAARAGERDGYERDARDEEILNLQSRLEQLERMLDRQSAPPIRRVQTARSSPSKTER